MAQDFVFVKKELLMSSIKALRALRLQVKQLEKEIEKLKKKVENDG
ncbi:MAG: hypothetical protein ACTSQG_09860 [Promethearchaeota archaeon]